MKKILELIIVVLISLFIFCSCNKYENGPSVSFLSPEKRLVGTHHLDKIVINDKETNPDEEGIKEDIFIFNKNGSGERFIKILAAADVTSSVFEWEFDDKKEKIKIREQSDDETWGIWNTYTILRLTKKELWLVVPYNNAQAEFHYKKN